MTPEELAAHFKRRGDFDSTRKNLLSDFQSSSVGQQFTTQLGDILQSCIDEDPSLLQREKLEFHQLMVERITKSSEYKKAQQFVDSLLQPAQYMSKIENTLMTIVKEHAPPPPEKVEVQEQDKDKEHRSSKKTVALSSTKQSKENSQEGNSKEIKSTSAVLYSTASTAKSATSLKAALSRKDDNEEPKGHGLADRRLKETMTIIAKRKELNLELPPRPQPRIKEHLKRGPNNGPVVKKELGLELMHSAESPLQRSRKHSHHPRKRNRRQQSVDSNSSLSSPPSSSEADSDGEDREKEGSRAKKLAKKSPKDYKEEETGEDGLAVATTESASKEQLYAESEVMEGIELAPGPPSGKDMDMENSKDEAQKGTTKQDDTKAVDAMEVDRPLTKAGDNTEDSSPLVKVDETSKDTRDEKTGADGQEPAVKDTRKDVTPDVASSIKSPALSNASVTRSGSMSSTSSSSTLSSVHNSPALPSTSAHHRRGSDALDNRLSSHSHHQHGSSQQKRTGHQPLPLPPRPNLSLPPKPTAPLSLNRKTSLARNTLSTVSGTGPVVSTSNSILKSTIPTLSTSASTQSSASSGSGSRHPSISGASGSIGSGREKTLHERSDTRSLGHGHMHHPLPPPPHLQHPLPPTPRGSAPGSRPQSLSLKTTSASSSSSKPLISTSQPVVGAGSCPDNSTPTTSTSKSTNSLTSPDSAGARNSPRIDDNETGVSAGRSSENAASTLNAGSKDEHSLKSPASNSSTGSISSTGSLSTTGSTSNLTMISTPELSSKEPASTSESTRDLVSESNSVQSPKSSQSPISSKEPESMVSTKEVAIEELIPKSNSDAMRQPTPPPPPPTSSPPPPESSPPPPPPPPPPEPSVTSPTPPPPPSTPTPTSGGSASSKNDKSLQSASSPSSALGPSSKPKSQGRTPIPLPSRPHKPIPLPRRPSTPATGTGAGSLKKKYK
ncbi:hypothetical protein BGX28_003550 [Mortierella sp. GBA30]|nr:hypothetical protein BGX28_003550 [Mortierella sp. GBA30]